VQRFPFTAKNGIQGIVRPATPRDARPSLAIVDEAVRERPRTLITTTEEFWRPSEWRRNRADWSARGVWLVAELDGRVVGSAGVSRGDRPALRHTAEIGLTVTTSARGIGVGRAMMETAEIWAKEFGVTRLTLGVFDTNERGRALYSSLGYVVEGIETGHVLFGDGDLKNVIRMAKFLTGTAFA